MSSINLSRKRTYARRISPATIVPRFKKFDDIEFLDVDRFWSIVVRVDVKFDVEDHGSQQRFIFMDTTGSKIEAIAVGRNVDRMNMLLNVGCNYIIHQVKFQPNLEEAVVFRSIAHPYECSLVNETRVEPYNDPIQFPPLPKQMMSFRRVYLRPNRTFVDIAGIAVHWAQTERIRGSLYREITLMDMRFNLIVVGIWEDQLTSHVLSLTSAAARNHIVLGTMLRKHRRHWCLETSDFTTLKFNPSHAAADALRPLQRSVATGVISLSFVNRFIGKRRAYLATVV